MINELELELDLRKLNGLKKTATELRRQLSGALKEKRLQFANGSSLQQH